MIIQSLFALPLLIVIAGVILSTPTKPRSTECRVLTEDERLAAYRHRMDEDIGLRSEEFARREAIGQAAKDRILAKIRKPAVPVTTIARKPTLTLRFVPNRKAG